MRRAGWASPAPGPRLGIASSVVTKLKLGGIDASMRLGGHNPACTPAYPFCPLAHRNRGAASKFDTSDYLLINSIQDCAGGGKGLLDPRRRHFQRRGLAE